MDADLYLKKIKRNMEPGAITQKGFLGKDKRGIKKIIEDDEKCLRDPGADFIKAAERLRYFMTEAEKKLGEPAVTEGRWESKIDDARGMAPCPFNDGLFRKCTVTLKDLSDGSEVRYSELSIHLAEKHHFLQGKGSNFRLEPEFLKKISDM